MTKVPTLAQVWVTIKITSEEVKGLERAEANLITLASGIQAQVLQMEVLASKTSNTRRYKSQSTLPFSNQMTIDTTLQLR